MVTDPVKVITLCENVVYSRNLIGEHGLSLLLEVRGKKCCLIPGRV